MKCTFKSITINVTLNRPNHDSNYLPIISLFGLADGEQNSHTKKLKDLKASSASKF